MKHLYILKYPAFRYYLFARFVSVIGDWFQNLAFPFAIYQVTGSGLSVAIALALQSVPYIIFAPSAGVLADKKSRKSIMIITDMVRGVGLVLIWFFGVENIPMLYVLAILLSTMSAFFGPASSSLFPHLIKDNKQDLTAANAMESLVSNVTMLIGPITGGILMTSVGVGYGFLINGLSFLFSGLLLLKLPQDVRTNTKPDGHKTSGKLINELAPYLRENPTLVKMIITGVIVSVGGAAFMALDSIIVQKVLNGTPTVYGFVTAAWGIGMLIATLSLIFITRISDFINYLVGIFLLGIATIGYGFSSTLWEAIIWNIVGGFANSLYFITNRSIIQQMTVESMLGRVFALRGLLSQFVMPIAMGICGAFSDQIGVSNVLLVAGLIVTITSFLGIFLFHENIKNHFKTVDTL